MQTATTVRHRGKVHVAGRKFTDHEGGVRYLPGCGSWSRRSHEYPRTTDEPVSCAKCGQLIAKEVAR